MSLAAPVGRDLIGPLARLCWLLTRWEREVNQKFLEPHSDSSLYLATSSTSSGFLRRSPLKGSRSSLMRKPCADGGAKNVLSRHFYQRHFQSTLGYYVMGSSQAVFPITAPALLEIHFFIVHNATTNSHGCKHTAGPRQ